MVRSKMGRHRDGNLGQSRRSQEVVEGHLNSKTTISGEPEIAVLQDGK